MEWKEMVGTNEDSMKRIKDEDSLHIIEDQIFFSLTFAGDIAKRSGLKSKKTRHIIKRTKKEILKVLNERN